MSSFTFPDHRSITTFLGFASRAKHSKHQVSFDIAEPVSEESIQEECDEGTRAPIPIQKQSSIEVKEGDSTSQVPTSPPTVAASSPIMDVGSMNSVFGKMDRRWVNRPPD